MKITRKMIDRAHNAHLRSETTASMNKVHAMEAVYHKQQRHMDDYNYYKRLVPKKLIDKYSSNEPPKRREPRRRQPKMFGLGIRNFRM